ncbi:hypothetical protein E24_00274 [Faustovirus]|nr:hypothetical protein PRJ_Fausto_00259 [Faustovirus]AMN83198.1 hypothetical protein E24_00274 [Faustovirus]AMN84179.1 hypothetical protein D5a_00273 [Faustovirus]AMN85168.1 hypothetical protein E23_00273 [Faustovirus]QBR99167.1 hypothetical protein [Faustovirus mariensis]
MDQQFDTLLRIVKWVTPINNLSKLKCTCWAIYTAVEYLVVRAKSITTLTVWFCIDNKMISYCGSRNSGTDKYCQTMHAHKCISLFDIKFKSFKIGYLITQILPKIHAELHFHKIKDVVDIMANTRCCLCIKSYNTIPKYNNVYNLQWCMEMQAMCLLIKPVWTCRKCRDSLPCRLNDVLITQNVTSPTMININHYRKLKSLCNDIKNKQFEIKFIENGNVGSLYF